MISGPSPAAGNPRMITGAGRPVVARNEQQAAWFMVEEGARPVSPSEFPWERVLTLTGRRLINPAVYQRGSVL